MLDNSEKDDILKEISILADMDHPNIVRLYEFYDESNKYCIVQELCAGGELFDVLIKKKRFGEEDAALIIKRVLNAINYCHNQGIVHRDLKPENILLEIGDDNTYDYAKLKLVDFGTAVPHQKKMLTSLTGTAYYMAPEVVAGKYNNKCDIWSIGVIAFMLISGKAPFYGKSNDQIFAMAK